MPEAEALLFIMFATGYFLFDLEKKLAVLVVPRFLNDAGLMCLIICCYFVMNILQCGINNVTI